MKKLALVGILASTFSFATSVRSVALELEDLPLRMTTENNQATFIRVAADGEVFGGTCEMKPAVRMDRREMLLPIEVDYSQCDWQTVRFLTRTELRQMNRRVKLAAHGTVRVLPGPLCMAISTRHAKLTAADGSVLLQEGNHPCGATTMNLSPAAQELVRFLGTLLGEYRNM